MFPFDLAIRRRRVAKRIDIMYIWLYILYMISPDIFCYIIVCYGSHVRGQAWRFCVAGWLPLS